MEGTNDSLSALDGVNRLLALNKYDYVLLMKRIKDKPYFTLYVTDSLDDFWIERYDVEYFQKTAQAMNLQGSMETLLKYIAEALNNNSVLKLKDGNMSVELTIKIGNSVNITHTFKVGVRINARERPQQFRKLNRTFVMHLFQAKQKETEKAQAEFDRYKKGVQEKDDKEKQVEQDNHQRYLSSVLKPQTKKAVKRGDLINPNKKKRRQDGIKFEITEELGRRADT